MTEYRWKAYLSFLLLLSFFAPLSCSQTNRQANEIVKKNIRSAGGKEKLTQIKNYSFKVGTKTYFMSSTTIPNCFIELALSVLILLPSI